jgi:hypothetical protein
MYIPKYVLIYRYIYIIFGKNVLAESEIHKIYSRLDVTKRPRNAATKEAEAASISWLLRLLRQVHKTQLGSG